MADYKAGITFNGYYLDNLGMFERFDLYELDGSQIIDGQIVANALKVLVLADAPKKDKAPKQASKK